MTIETITDIIFTKNHNHLFHVPIEVIVKHENYRGPVLVKENSICIPICPITVSSQTEVGYHFQELPFRLALALKIHKSQELTLSKRVKFSPNVKESC